MKYWLLIQTFINGMPQETMRCAKENF